MNQKADVRVIAGGLILSGAAMFLIVGLFLLRIRTDVGALAFDPEQVADVREVTGMIIEGYKDVIALITGAFGAIAFLVTYQQKQSASITSRAWGLLAAGLVFLTGALILALLGREYLLLMLGRNAVDLGLPMLDYARWASYACLVCAALFTSFFAIEVAISRPQSEAAHQLPK